MIIFCRIVFISWMNIVDSSLCDLCLISHVSGNLFVRIYVCIAFHISCASICRLVTPDTLVRTLMPSQIFWAAALGASLKGTSVTPGWGLNLEPLARGNDNSTRCNTTPSTDLVNYPLSVATAFSSELRSRSNSHRKSYFFVVTCRNSAFLSLWFWCTRVLWRNLLMDYRHADLMPCCFPTISTGILVGFK